MEEINGQDEYLISVVVPPTGDGNLPRLRQALAIQTLPPGEIIIIQDGQKHGAAWARNQGLRNADGNRTP